MATFGGLVVGCIGADSCNQMFVLQHRISSSFAFLLKIFSFFEARISFLMKTEKMQYFWRSRKCMHFCIAPKSLFKKHMFGSKISDVGRNSATMCKNLPNVAKFWTAIPSANLSTNQLSFGPFLVSTKSFILICNCSQLNENLRLSAYHLLASFSWCE